MKVAIGAIAVGLLLIGLLRLGPSPALATGTAAQSVRQTSVSKVLTANTTTIIDLTELTANNLTRNDTASMVFKVTGSGTVDLEIWAEVTLDLPGEASSTQLGWARSQDTPELLWSTLNTTGATALYIPLPQGMRLAVKENAGNAGLTFKAKVAMQ